MQGIKRIHESLEWRGALELVYWGTILSISANRNALFFNAFYEGEKCNENMIMLSTIIPSVERANNYVTCEMVYWCTSGYSLIVHDDVTTHCG